MRVHAAGSGLRGVQARRSAEHAVLQQAAGHLKGGAAGAATRAARWAERRCSPRPRIRTGTTSCLSHVLPSRCGWRWTRRTRPTAACTTCWAHRRGGCGRTSPRGCSGFRNAAPTTARPRIWPANARCGRRRATLWRTMASCCIGWALGRAPLHCSASHSWPGTRKLDPAPPAGHWVHLLRRQRQGGHGRKGGVPGEASRDAQSRRANLMHYIFFNSRMRGTRAPPSAPPDPVNDLSSLLYVPH